MQFVLFSIMPLSEFLRMARGKLESGQQRPGPTDFSARSENGLVELVWNNGQIGVQGQSSRGTTRSPTRNARNDSNNARYAKFGGVESILNDMAPVVPSGDLDLTQDDEMVPWLSYDPVGRDYVADLLPEISGVTANGMSTQNSFVTVDKTRTVGNTLKADKDHRALSSWPPQGGNVMNGSTSVSIRPPTSSSNFLNFSHFSRPANLVKANTDGIERMEVKEKGSVKEIDYHGSSTKLAMVDSREPPKGSRPNERTENLCQETCGKNEKPPILDNSRKGGPDGEINVEPMVASSSVGSGNSVDRVSCEQTQNSKRKFVDIEESECRSDDVETESLDVKRGTCVRGSKRGRAAEVHNLSERRRRDRINEKMRALQELIPNCNKADKASMLDEAIEYLKTLQLQVQIMSMGTGLYMPPMMFPTGMQHMYPHFPPMGVGMGYGPMGMVDMNGGSTGCPIFPVPPMQVAHFPPQMPGFQRMPGPNGPVFGNPSQGPPSSVPRAPFGPFAGPPHATLAMGLGALRNGNNGEVPSSTMNPRDPMTTINPQPTCNTEAGSIKDNSNQTTNEALDQCISVQETNQGMYSGAPPSALTSTTTDISKEPGCD